MHDSLLIESLDLDARGIAHRDGKTIYVEGGLPGEYVAVHTLRRKPAYEIARVNEVVRASSQRVHPRCPHFGVCGGCALQHLNGAAQVAVKQRTLEDAFWRVAKLRPQYMLPPIHGPDWGYRHRARLTVRVVPKKGGVLVGFHERKSSYVVDMQECHVLPPHVSKLLLPLRALVAALSIPDRIPQIEVAVGDSTTALVLRHLEPLTAEDRERLHTFAEVHKVQWWLQPKGPDSAEPMVPHHARGLYYSLPEFGLRMQFRPTDFTQVNPHVNRVMVRLALNLLDVQPEHRVADFFCGLGNFTLPLAQQCTEVVGVEGSAVLIERAQEAARRYQLEKRSSFLTCNLFDVNAQWLTMQGHFDRMLLDPPREGAEAVALALAAISSDARPERIVYVSCNPASLARDAAILVHQAQYRLSAAGVINMFPHTRHVESIAVFVKGSQ